MAKNSNNNRGSVLVEGLLSFTWFVLVGTSFLYIAKLVWVRMWLDFILYNALICVAETRPRFVCENQAKQHAKVAFLPAEQISLSFQQHSNIWEGLLKWQASNDKPIEIKQVLELSAKTKKAWLL